MQFERDGAEHSARAVDLGDLKRLDSCLRDAPERPGLRLVGRPDIDKWLHDAGVVDAACARLGGAARPVRAILFDKNDASNWSLGWHQDRTIAVAKRADVPGYGPWSVKAEICHVEPPFGLIERMATVRIHLDPVPDDNAPLLVVPGSHRLGRLDDDEVAMVGAKGPAVSCVAETADAWWYRTAIVHASARSAAGKRRRVLQVDFSADELPLPLVWRGLA